MKRMMQRRIMSAFVVLSMLFLVACGSGDNTPQNSDEKTGSVSTEQSASSGFTSTESFDPFGKYEPAIDITVGRATNSTYKFIEGESFDNNIWNTEYKNVLGINIKNSFIVDSSQYESKVNVVIASGNIPDLMSVSAKQTKMLMDADLIYDISGIFDDYASPLLKKVVTGDPKIAAASKIEGKLMGIPVPWGLDFQVPEVYIRSDWMKKLSLPEPKTFGDLLKIAETFVTQDPDGDKKKDTIGIPLNKDLSLTSGVGDFGAWLNMLHAYKGIWLKDDSGNLVYSSIQPEMRAALQKLQELYRNGIIDQEFSVKDGGKVAQDIVAENVGLYIGVFWSPAYPLQDLKNKNPDSDWNVYPIFSVDDKPALSQASVNISQFFVIKKKCEHPEAILKLCNLTLEDRFGSRSEEWSKITMSDKYKNMQTHKYSVIEMETPTLNRDLFNEVQAAMDSNDPSKLILQGSKDDYNGSQKFLKGDNKFWNIYRVRGDKNGGMGVAKKILDSDSIKYNEFFGIPGPVAIEKGSTMDKLENEIFTKIVMDAAPISDFDKFAEQWKKIGGDDLTKEVNDWYAKNK
mgnify:CR=1 FL=1